MFGEMPLIVLTAGEPHIPATDPEEAERKRNQAAMTTLSRNSKQIIVQQSGHHIHVEYPGLVADAIKQVIEAAGRKGKLEH